MGSREVAILLALKARDDASSQINSVRGSLGGLSGAAVAGVAMAATAAIGLGAVAVKLASDFDDAMRQVETQGGISAAEMEKLKGPVLDLSAAIGTSATDLAKALMPIAAEGFKGAEAMNVLKAAGIGAKVGNADLMTTTLALTTAMKDYNVPAAQATKTMDLLLKATANGRTSFQDLGGSLATVAPMAAAFHVPMAAVLGDLTQMTSQGIPARQAAQELRMTISSLVAPSSGASKELKSLGITSNELAKMLTSGPDGLTNAMELITEAVGKKFPAGSAAYDAALKSAFGNIKALQGALVLTGDHFKATIAATNDLAHASDGAGYTMSKWADVQKDLGTQVSKAKESINAMLIRVGEFLIPLITQALAWIQTKMIPAIIDFAKRIGPDLKVALDIAGGAISVVINVFKFLIQNFQIFGPLLAGVIGAFIAWKAAMLVGDIIQGVTVAVSLFQAGLGGLEVSEAASATTSYALGAAIDFMTGPIGLVLAAVAALIAIGVLLITHWQQVINFAGNVWKTVSGFFANLWHDVTTFVGNLVKDVVGFFTGLPGKILGAVIGYNLLLLNAGKALLGGLGSGISAGWSAVWGFISGLPGRILGAVIAFDRLLVNAGLALLRGLWNGIVAGAAAVWQFFGNIPSAILNILSGLGNILYNIGRAILTGLWNGLKSVWNDLTGWIGGIGDWISKHKGPLDADAQLLVPHGQAIMNGLHAGLRSQIPAILGTLSGLSGAMAGAVSGQGTYMLGTGGVGAGGTAVAVGAAAAQRFGGNGGGMAAAAGGSQPTIVQLVIDKRVLGQIMLNEHGRQARLQNVGGGGR